MHTSGLRCRIAELPDHIQHVVLNLDIDIYDHWIRSGW